MTAAEQIEKRGMQQGMLIGRQEGEQNKALAIVRNLLRKNMDASFIAETTGIDKQTISKLQAQGHTK